MTLAQLRKVAGEYVNGKWNSRDQGFIGLAEQAAHDWGTAEGLARALERGACCLCTCGKGRWWFYWFRQLAEPYQDREGKWHRSGFTMPETGIPFVGAA